MIDVDSQCKKGTLIYFDGRCSHGVKIIKGSGIGRLDVFAVPAYFQVWARQEILACSSRVYVEEFIDRFPLLRATRALVDKFKHLMR